MYISDGIVYGGEPTECLKVVDIKPLPDMMMLISFSSGEQRLFDATVLTGPVFEPLKNHDVFFNPEIEHGTVTWDNGEIDCAPEYMYSHSFEYSNVS